MIYLEHYQDKLNEHEIWVSQQRGELTRDEIEDFRDEFEALIRDLRSEVESLDDDLQSSLEGLESSLPTCSVCGDELDEDALPVGMCDGCAEEEGEW